MRIITMEDSIVYSLTRLGRPTDGLIEYSRYKVKSISASHYFLIDMSFSY
jgi:hypothetical protein